MSDIIDISNLHKDYKEAVDKDKFLEAQHRALTDLIKRNKELEKQVAHLQELLISTSKLLSEPKVEKIIVTPEEALIDRQIYLIQDRGLDRELTLEDTKKLDLLLKNKNIIKADNKSLEGTSTKVSTKLSNKELIQIASQKKNEFS